MPVNGGDGRRNIQEDSACEEPLHECDEDPLPPSPTKHPVLSVPPVYLFDPVSSPPPLLSLSCRLTLFFENQVNLRGGGGGASPSAASRADLRPQAWDQAHRLAERQSASGLHSCPPQPPRPPPPPEGATDEPELMLLEISSSRSPFLPVLLTSIKCQR